MTNEELLAALIEENRKLLEQIKELTKEPYRPCTVHLNCSGGSEYCNDNGPRYEMPAGGY
jgi:hypothetical protein